MLVGLTLHKKPRAQLHRSFCMGKEFVNVKVGLYAVFTVLNLVWKASPWM